MIVSGGNDDPILDPLSVTTTNAGPGNMMITVCGEIDFMTSEFLDTEFCQALDPAPRSLVVDLNGVDFCDTSGLSVLVGLTTRCGADRIAVRFLPSATIRRLLQRTGLSGLLPIAES